MPFLSHTHQQRFSGLIDRDNTQPRDRERRAMFYIFAGSNDLLSKVNHLYNFKEHCIIPDPDTDLSGGIRSLLELAFNLYNGYGKSTVVDIFANLDANNFKLAMNAIQIRFDRESSPC